MAIAGPLVAYLVYILLKKIRAPKSLGIFLAASISDLVTYCVTAFQLALAHPAEIGGFTASFVKFLGIFAITQVPLAVVEGLLTVIVIKGLEAYAKPELIALGHIEERVRNEE